MALVYRLLERRPCRVGRGEGGAREVAVGGAWFAGGLGGASIQRTLRAASLLLNLNIL